MGRLLVEQPLAPARAIRVLHEKAFEDPGATQAMRLAAVDDGLLVGFCVGAARRSNRRGHIKLLRVAQAYRRQGLGSRLLKGVELALCASPTDQPIRAIRIDESAPNYLNPGVNQRNLIARQFFESQRYSVVGEAMNMEAPLDRSFDTTDDERQLRESGVLVRRATSEDGVPVAKLLQEHWPAWQMEVRQVLEHRPISLHLAVKAQRVVGFAAHNANNRGTAWFGPMGTAPLETGRGIGRVLLLRCLADLMSLGYKTVTIPWVAPVEFYRRICGAEVSERFWRMEKELDAV